VIQPASRPTVSVVIPVRDEVHSIGNTLDSCLDQSYTGSLEIIVADAMSTDGTRDVVRKYSDAHPVCLVDNPDRSTPAGLNAAIEEATGDVIVRCDAHSVLPPDYVETAVRILHETNAANVGGVQRAVGTEPMQRGIAAAMTNFLGVGDARFHRGGPPGEVDTVYLGVFDRFALEGVGGFDETLVRNQDYELNVRLREAGHTVWFDPSLEVRYSPRSTLAGLWRQYYQYGNWKRTVIGMHPSSLRARQAAPPLLVVGLAGAALLLATPLRRVGAAAIGAYAAALGAAGIREAIRTKDAAALLSAPSIGVMHISWGLGFLIGSRGT
jgi:succinoglycan biosynthesis protein ExoA